MTHEGLVNFMVSCKASVGNTRGSRWRHHVRALSGHCISPNHVANSPLRPWLMWSYVRFVLLLHPLLTFLIGTFTQRWLTMSGPSRRAYVPTPLTDHRIVMTPRLL